MYTTLHMHLNEPTFIPTRLSLLTPAGLFSFLQSQFYSHNRHYHHLSLLFYIHIYFSPSLLIHHINKVHFAKIENKRICCKYNGNYTRKNGGNVLKNCNIIWSSIKFPIKATLKGKESQFLFFFFYNFKVYFKNVNISQYLTGKENSILVYFL